MRKNSVTVLDIGSSKITVAAAERGINNTFVIKGYASRNYAGFSDGEFFDVDELQEVIAACVKQVEDNVKYRIDKIYVGVPGEFTSILLRDKQLALNKTRKASAQDLLELYDSAFDLQSKKYTLINRSGIYFTLDNVRKVADPVGVVCRIIKGYMSFILCNNYIINLITPMLNKTGISSVEFTSTSLSQALYLFEPEYRDRTAVLLDIGYITSTFSIIKGDAVVYQKSFSHGGGYITAALTGELGIDPDIAEKLKRKVNLSCNGTSGSYDVIDGNKEYVFSANKVNSIVLSSLDELCDYIGACLNDFELQIPEYVPISLTGGGISFMRGAKEHISKRLNFIIETIAPSLPHMNKPTDSSLVSLLDLALRQPVKRENFIKKYLK